MHQLEQRNAYKKWYEGFIDRFAQPIRSLPLPQRLQAIEKLREDHQTNEPNSESDEPLSHTKEDVPKSEKTNYVSRAGTISGGFRQRIGERSADLFLRASAKILVFATILFVIIAIILWLLLH